MYLFKLGSNKVTDNKLTSEEDFVAEFKIALLFESDYIAHTVLGQILKP